MIAISSRDKHMRSLANYLTGFIPWSLPENPLGLGLAIARTLVEQMVGTIYAGYEEGRLHMYCIFEGQRLNVFWVKNCGKSLFLYVIMSYHINQMSCLLFAV